MKRVLAMVLLLLMLPAAVLAERMYVLPDSDKRLLSWDEVAEWDYESLGYAFNEIFARHGYDFIPGGEYEYYFETKPWYRPNGTFNNQRDCYSQLTRTEWANYELIKEVRAYKRYNDGGRSIWDSFSTGFETLQGFDYVELRSGQKLEVYSAPSSKAWRGANGKAVVGTNGAIYAAGWDGDWLLIMYETNKGSVRVGYINGNKVRGGVPLETSLHFEYAPATVLSACTLTDDPARSGTEIVTLQPGAQVIYLSRFYNNSAWDYVETTVKGKTTRGFVRAGSLNVSHAADPLESLNYSK